MGAAPQAGSCHSWAEAADRLEVTEALSPSDVRHDECQPHGVRGWGSGSTCPPGGHCGVGVQPCHAPRETGVTTVTQDHGSVSPSFPQQMVSYSPKLTLAPSP